MIRKVFMSILTMISGIVSAAGNRCRQIVEAVDPFDNRGIAFSHASRAFHRFGYTAAMGVALVAVHLLPASAMSVHLMNHGARTAEFYTNHNLGLLGSAGAVMGATQAPALRPFRVGTVRRRINIGNFAIAPGTQLPSIVIPQVGMLSRVLIDIEGGYTVANAPLVVATLATLGNISDGMDAILSRAQIQLNNGSANLVDVSGVGLNIVNQNISSSLPIKRGTAGTGNVQGTGFPLAIGAGRFSYKAILPVNANQRRQFEMGLINLQAPETRCTVNLSFNALASIFTTPANCTAFTATCNISYEYYEIPNLSVYQLPPLTIVRTIEEGQIAISATGVQLYQFPRLGTMIEYHGVFVANNIYGSVNPGLGSTAGFTEMDIRYNKTDTQYQMLIGDLETYEAEIYGYGVGAAVTASAATGNAQTSLNPSALSLNLWAADNKERNGGDFRDAIDTEENTTTEVLITVGAGQALNAGKDFIFHVRRVVQRIVPAPAPGAQAA